MSKLSRKGTLRRSMNFKRKKTKKMSSRQSVHVLNRFVDTEYEKPLETIEDETAIEFKLTPHEKHRESTVKAGKKASMDAFIDHFFDY